MERKHFKVALLRYLMYKVSQTCISVLNIWQKVGNQCLNTSISIKFFFMSLLFGQHQQVFVRTGRSDVTTVTNVWIDLINVMCGDTAL